VEEEQLIVCPRCGKENLLEDDFVCAGCSAIYFDGIWFDDKIRPDYDAEKWERE